jgi:hypothetical protein
VLKPDSFAALNAALKRRTSTEMHASSKNFDLHVVSARLKPHPSKVSELSFSANEPRPSKPFMKYAFTLCSLLLPEIN